MQNRQLIHNRKDKTRIKTWINQKLVLNSIYLKVL